MKINVIAGYGERNYKQHIAVCLTIVSFDLRFICSGLAVVTESRFELWFHNELCLYSDVYITALNPI